MKKSHTPTATVNTDRDAKRFRKIARAYVKTVTVSKKAAQDTLVELGTHTRTGKISKNYK